MLRFLIAPILVHICLMGCSAGKTVSRQSHATKQDDLKVAGRISSGNKIIFLTFQVALTDSVLDTYRFTLTNTIVAEGILNRNAFLGDPPIEPFSLYCEITDETKKRVEMIRLPNPLLKVFEYSPDKSILEKRVFASNSGELYLRFQFTVHSKYLSIYKPQPGSQTLKKIYHAQI